MSGDGYFSEILQPLMHTFFKDSDLNRLRENKRDQVIRLLQPFHAFVLHNLGSHLHYSSSVFFKAINKV
jgi:hypothetical protein